jgi:diguanylate cyclase (GGDEF)-like protein
MERLQENAKHLEALNRQLRETANRDGLTGLYNHRYFREALEVEISRAARHGHAFSLIFIDIDHFKMYNDSNGHLLGDSVLRDLAKILRRYSRESTLVARYGGEEFVLIVPETDGAAANTCAENLRARVAAYTFEGARSQPQGRVTLSAGVASYPDDARDANTLIERADQALYLAKDSGRNAVRCWTSMRDSVAEGAEA